MVRAVRHCGGEIAPLARLIDDAQRHIARVENREMQLHAIAAVAFPSHDAEMLA